MSSTPFALTSIPRLADGVALERLSLTPSDGFLLSRIDGGTSVEMLVDLVGVPADEVLAALQRLVELGAVVIDAAAPGAVDAAPSASGAGELSREERAQILAAERALAAQTYWQLLELTTEPTAADLKRAYFAQSRKFHPDRYFGKDLGDLKPRLERVFKAIKAAYDVLSDDTAGAIYSRQHPPPWATPAAAVAGGPPSPSPSSSEEALERRRQAIIEERRQRQRAGGGGSSKARELHGQGIKLLSAGDFAGAATAFKQASAHDPANAEYKRLHDEAHEQATFGRANQLVEYAETLLGKGQTAEAAQSMMQAFNLAPEKINYALRAAELYLEAGNAERAWPCVQRALTRSPRRKDVRLMAAKALQARGDSQAAQAQLNAIADFEQVDPRATNLLGRLGKLIGKS